MTPPDPAKEACLARTRSAVLNVLMAAAAGITVSALILRSRDEGAAGPATRVVRLTLLGILMVLALASHLARRWGTSRGRLGDPLARASRFYRAHLISAIIASAAVPVGFAYGWFVRPELDGVGPFWAAALALGFLALPRAASLDDFDEPTTESSAPQQ